MQEVKGKLEYRTKDLKLDAVFQTAGMSPWIYLEQAECRVGIDEIVSAIPDTGCYVHGSDFKITVQSKALLKLMMESVFFNHGNGFWPHPEDPGGFWRAMGVLKTKEVTIVVNDGQEPVKFDDLVFSKLNFAKKESVRPMKAKVA